MSVGLPCQPFGPTIQCTCDKRGQALRCLPVIELKSDFDGGAHGGNSWSTSDWTKAEEENVMDQRTEVILAFTLLVIIVLTFIL